MELVTNLSPRDLAAQEQSMRLRVEITEVQDELRKGDTKALGLLGLFGAGLAAVVALYRDDVAFPATVLLFLAALPMGSALAFLLLTVRPWLEGTGGFLRWAAYHREPEAVIADLADATPAELAHELVGLSVLAVNRYRRIRTAVHLLLPALALIALALPLA
ncbi:MULTISPECIES: Pycsar system effector family protein [Actinosynnema]|uniref:Pycsar system effector family protein n=1 Tax=Actinosynnema TaxID=40566 RepID=UPI0020A3ACCF|nr:Pycsar system effector family protein [Actinosynnema pretiosum]MCP2098982.1 hypothetical protein [Actinosynnema pretiosum]